MAAILKKRAMAQYSQTIQDTSFHPPIKRLRLVKKPVAEFSALALVSCLESCKNSNEVLRTLLRLSDNLSFDVGDIPETITRLCVQFKNESESAVRVKILSLLGDIGLEPNADITVFIEETITLLKHEFSHKVIAQGLNTLLKLSKIIPENVQIHTRIVDLAKNYLKDVNHAVKCKCLEIIGALTPVTNTSETQKILQLILSYFNNDDARVRSQAFSTVITLHERGVKLNPDMYNSVCAALKDDYEIVRRVVLKLICLIGKTYPENMIILSDSEQEIRLIDDAFGKICIGVTDLSMHVRVLAAKLLGTMTEVSSKFLNQTLDKKLMSNMRRKRTAHELAWENITSGEWASGKKWADDAPREVLDAESISLMSSGACGAFVHGLEDEFLEVRTASVESLCQLSLKNPEFAVLSLDFLVDMFNDEIEDVRIIAIDSLRRVSEHIILRDDQIETILAALEDFSQEVREGLHQMLASCKMATTQGLKMSVEKLWDNLKRYNQDRRSTYLCLQQIGAKHPELVLTQVPLFLTIHPFFDIAEPDVDNPQYICQLILVFNAAKHSPTIVPVLEEHTLRHYAYLRDTMPHLVPELNLTGLRVSNSARQISAPESLSFLRTVVSSFDTSENSFLRIQTSLLQTAKEHLKRLSDMDPTVAGTAKFLSLFIGAQLLMSQVLEKGLWTNPANLPTQQAHNLKSNIEQLLQNCLKLQHLFVGVNSVDSCTVKQLRLKALALNLVYIVRGSNASALAPCHHFLSMVEEMHRELYSAGLEPDSFTAAVFKELSAIEEPKPGTVARILIPILQDSKLGRIPEPSIEVQMSNVVIYEPSGQTEKQHKFTAGLVLAVPFEAELTHLLDPSRLRLKVKYPDQRTQIILPKPMDFRPLLFDNQENKVGHNLRILTTVLISHQVWSEACNVDISVALSIPDADVTKRKNSIESVNSLLDLCKPVRVSVAPKPIKRTL